jgi:hypothetical protein
MAEPKISKQPIQAITNFHTNTTDETNTNKTREGKHSQATAVVLSSLASPDSEPKVPKNQ